MGILAGFGRFTAGTVGVVFLAVWVLGWSAGTLVFDAVLVRGVVANVRAAEWPTTGGTVLHSALREERDSDGDVSHVAELRYAYQVRGERYEGTTYRPGEIRGLGGKPARQIVAENPVGRTVTVHYNPHHPPDAALDIGVGAGEGFMLLFLTPFNLVMVVCWWALAAWVIRRPKEPPPAGGVPLIDDGRHLRARLPRVWPMTALLGTLLGSTFAGVFVAGLGFTVLSHDIVVAGAWVLVLAVTGSVFARVARLVRPGRPRD